MLFFNQGIFSMNLDLHSAIIERLNFYLNKYHLNQKDFCFLSGISRSFYYNVINRKNSPSIDFIIRVADCFNIAACDFLSFVPLQSFREGFTTYNVLIDADQKFENPYKVIKSIGIRDYSTCFRAVNEENMPSLIQSYRELLSKRIREYIQLSNETCKSFAEQTGISEPYLYNIHAAQKSITIKILQMIYDSPVKLNIQKLFCSSELDQMYYPCSLRMFIDIPNTWDSFSEFHKSI